MSVKEETFNINGVDYEMRKAGFMKTKTLATKLLTLLNGALNFDKEMQIDINIGAIAQNLNSPEMAEIEKFVMDQTIVAGFGKLSDSGKLDEHFEEHPDNYFLVLFEGVKFHFLPLLPVGREFLQNMNLSKLAEMGQK